MEKYTTKTFNIGELDGISRNNIEEHLKLYAGYVKHANLIQEKIKEYKKDENHAYALGEINRRFPFEYNGMRNHEVYFALLENGKIQPNTESVLYKKIESTWGSFENWLNEFKAIAMTRGIGWAVLYYDQINDSFLNCWVDEQHIGQLQNCKPIIALDMWEHAFVYDYATSQKKDYIEAFFRNLNWSVAEEKFATPHP
ncbi:hypothetical protein A3C57_03175 [Candidatus Nomurabacteria bacterium RIFCSPHIGHO2_02_FULL_33_12]|nr:MAG: hypothetical protein A3C57_03175 [Candidatus Nomurabacteria bacterium RIFCSPHIGHO2_02_FULL_33_12]